MENVKFQHDKALQDEILVEILLTKVGRQGGDSMSIVTYFLR